jgi:four helix bundle protein
MTPDELKDRSKKFALRAIQLVASLPRVRAAQLMGDQLLRAGTAVGANYRSACRARSRADFVAKMGIVEEETDESLYWLELLSESGLMTSPEVDSMHGEGQELLAIFSASRKTARDS